MKNIRQPQFTLFMMVFFLSCLIFLVVFDGKGQKEFREYNQRVDEINTEANKARNDKFCELYRQEFRITQSPPAYQHCFEEVK